MMHKIFLLVAVLALMAGALIAQDKTVTLDGYLIDNACADSAKDLGPRAKGHSTKCALMDSCETSGYSVYADDNKRYKLDDKGNDAAADLLKNTKTTKGVKVKVEGTIDGETFKVTKITEVTE